jgi:hypothetical protein
MNRLYSKARRIRQKVGGSGNSDDPFPDKPKGMHWKTYNRLRDRCYWLEDSADEHFVLLAGRFLGGLRR